ncbi:MAG TPA: hypothetical protein VHJ17_13370, partial [Thermomonospora sp.]|nr:hypothetical protein [Thermomonospora sp.]
MALVGLVVSVALTLLGTGLAGTLKDAAERELCRLAQRQGCPGTSHASAVNPPAPAARRDPDEPAGSCLTGIDSEYLEFDISAKYRKAASLASEGGSQVQLRRKVGADGKPFFEVWDMSWMDASGGLGVPSDKDLSLGGWLAAQ